MFIICYKNDHSNNNNTRFIFVSRTLNFERYNYIRWYLYPFSNFRPCLHHFHEVYVLNKCLGPKFNKLNKFSGNNKNTLQFYFATLLYCPWVNLSPKIISMYATPVFFLFILTVPRKWTSLCLLWGRRRLVSFAITWASAALVVMCSARRYRRNIDQILSVSKIIQHNKQIESKISNPLRSWSIFLLN